MDFLKDKINDIRVFILAGISRLPSTIAAVLLIVGMFTANYAALFFLLGFLIITPLVAFLVNLISEYAIDSIDPTLLYTIKGACMVNIPFQRISNRPSEEYTFQICSEWLAMFAFFIGYMTTNALDLQSTASDQTSDPKLDPKYQRRMSQLKVSLATIIVVAVLVIGYRIVGTKCDYPANWLIGSIMLICLAGYGAAGYGWYQFLTNTIAKGHPQLADLFGIANRLITPDAGKDQPVVCLPQKA